MAIHNTPKGGVGTTVYKRAYDSGAWSVRTGDKGNRVYHGGQSGEQGYWNGNMLSIISLSDAKTFCANKGWNINSVKLDIYCDWCYNHAAGAKIRVGVCNGGPSGSDTSESKLKITNIHSTVNVKENSWVKISIPVDKVRDYKYIVFYKEGVYNDKQWYTYFNVFNEKVNSEYKCYYIIDYVDKITPTAPALVLDSDYPIWTKHNFWLDGVSRTYDVFPAYGGNQTPGSNSKNSLYFRRSGGGSFTSCQIHLQYKRPGAGWTYASGYPKTYGGSTTISRTVYTTDSGSNYNTGDRYSNGEVYWCAWITAKSSTGHSARSDYRYFLINGNPVLGSSPSCSSDGWTISLDCGHNNINLSNGDAAWYFVRYTINGGGLRTPHIHKRNSRWISYTRNDLGASPGDTVRFYIVPGDSNEWNDACGWGWSSNDCRIPILPAAPSVSISATNSRTITRDGWVVYAGRNINSGEPGRAGANTLTFHCSRSSGANAAKIMLERYDNNSGWARYHDMHGFSGSWSPSVGGDNAGNDFNAGHRWGKSLWRVSSYVESATGHGASSSNTIYFGFNNVPRISSCSLDINGKTLNIYYNVSDNLHNNTWVYIVAIIKRGGQTIYKTPATHQYSNKTSISLNVSDIGAQSSDRVSFKLIAGDDLEWNETGYSVTNEVVVNTAPSLTGRVAADVDQPYNSYFGTTVKLDWPKAIDPDTNQALTYEVRASKNSGAWEHVITTSDRTITSSPKIQKGENIKFSVRAYDTIEHSDYIYTNLLKRSRNPEPPKAVNINPVNYHENIVESISNTTWDAVTQDCGNTMAKYRVKLYSNNRVVQTVEVTSTNAPLDITKVTRGETFKAGVVCIDSFNNESIEKFSKEWKRNMIPAKPIKFRSVNNDGKVSGHIQLAWAPGADEGIEALKYHIEFSVNKGPYNHIYTTANTSYDYKLPVNVVEGNTLGFRIKAEDRHGVMSEYADMEKNHLITVNYKPRALTVLYPKTPGSIHKEKNRIIFKVPVELDNDDVVIHANVGGKQYNSSDNREVFHLSKYKGNIEGTFIHTEVNSRVEFKTTDGLDYSPQTLFDFKDSDWYIRFFKDEIITASKINNLMEKIEKTALAYDVKISIKRVTKDELITASSIIAIDQAIKTVKDKLDSRANHKDVHRAHTILKSNHITQAIADIILNNFDDM